MKKIIANVGIILGVISNVVYADSADYDSEISGLYTKSGQSKTYGVSYIHYLDTIKPGNTPLAEATFFSRSSSFSVAINDSDTKTSGINFDGRSLNVNYTYSEKTNPFTFLIGYTKEDDDISTSSATGSSDGKSYQISLGYYIYDNLHTTIGYFDREATLNHPGITNTSSEYSAYSATVKYIHQMDDSTALSITGSRSHTTSSTNVSAEKKSEQTSLRATFYFDQFFGLGAVYAMIDSDTAASEYSYIGIKASYFITPKFSITAYHYEFDTNAASTLSDYSSSSIIASLRF